MFKSKVIFLIIFMLPWKAMADTVTQPAPGQMKTQAAQEIQAKQTVSQKTMAAANEIADINERLAVLAARLAELELQAKIATKKSEINKAYLSPVALDDPFIPSVMEIDGVDGKMRALLYVQGGNTQSVRIGDKVGSWKIKDIQMDSVTVQRGAETLRLSFGSLSDNPSSAPGGNLQLPPVPSFGSK